MQNRRGIPGKKTSTTVVPIPEEASPVTPSSTPTPTSSSTASGTYECLIHRARALVH
jgi:hypothetical protein